MIFSSPSWVPQISGAAPDTQTVGEFVLDPNSRLPLQTAGTPPFVDAISGKSYLIENLRERVELLARSLAQNLGWSPNAGDPWDKVVAIYSINTIDYFVLCWAVHRLNGICLPLHSTSTVAEITSHMVKAHCRTIFSCQSLMPTCLEAMNELSIPLENVYSLDSADKSTSGSEHVNSSKSLEQLVREGSQLEPLEPLQWAEGQGKKQVAYLCPTSGTSGKQKLAILTHYGLIANIVQTTTFENFAKAGHGEVATGAVPFSHSYGLFLGHMAVWRGDTIVVFPRFDMQLMLKAIPQYQIERLYLVPAILAAMAANPFLFKLFDLSSVTSVITGAAALSQELAGKLHSLVPKWHFLHGYGLTETSVLASLTSSHDIWPGSSGSLIPGCQLRLVGEGGQDVKEYDEPGEILVKSPNLFVGYVGDEDATKNTFDEDGWLRTGDVGVMKVGPDGAEHLFIRDRLKDMIKVKGMQVVPVDIETLLLTHPAVVEVAVIGVPDDLAGERPRAFIVRSESIMADLKDEDLRDSLDDKVEGKLHETHWLNGRIDFIAAIPKNQNGKVLKRELRAMVAAE